MSRIRPARLALPWVLGLAMACTEQSEPPAAPPSAPAAAPAAAEQRARPATIETTTTTTTITPPARQCEGEGLARFPCDHGTLCASVDALDDTVTLTELLCVVRSARSPDDTLRIGDILRDLPARFRLNFTLKHGTKGSGLRGHPQELMADVVGDALAKRSQSADLDFPRVIMWDQATGTTISFNGGLTASGADTRTQTGADRLDLMGWDSKAHRFELWGLDIPVGHEGGDSAWAVAPYQPHEPDDDCLRCHGPRSRPIWPMYPDWPGFYGSDNDELTGDSTHQTTEREFLGYFRHCVAAGPVVPQVGDQPAVDCAKVRGAAAALPDGATPGPADLVDTRRRYDTLFAAGLDEELGARFRRADRDAVRTYITGLDERL
ncbi:MAG: hypothetical protein K0V04_06290, partial [Deltaproteobacteria bacterium]|nr:hypothetical protein [Deltaproteobacteria bacterium]